MQNKFVQLTSTTSLQLYSYSMRQKRSNSRMI